jgi:hypothetical protein
LVWAAITVGRAGWQDVLPRAARAQEATVAVPVVSTASGAMNRFKLNEAKLNG